MNQKISTRRIAMAGLLAALTAVGSALRITIPVTIGGTSAFHLGNIFCALSGILLGPGLGGVAAGLGSAIYDMTTPAYISEAWLTFLLKGAYALAAGLAYRHLKLGEYLRDKKAGINPDVPVNKKNQAEQIYMRPAAAKALEEMFAAAKEEKGYVLLAVSGYRSYGEQQLIFNNKVNAVGSKEAAQKKVAPAGASEHQLGLAQDVLSGYGRRKMAV